VNALTFSKVICTDFFGSSDGIEAGCTQKRNFSSFSKKFYRQRKNSIFEKVRRSNIANAYIHFNGETIGYIIFKKTTHFRRENSSKFAPNFALAVPLIIDPF
jgi:hypothetical protein